MALSIAEVVERAREDISALTGLELSSTLGTIKEERGWRVTVELIEKHSLPDGMDILASYDIVVDPDGNLVEFTRGGLRKRIDTEEEGLEK